jgi:hypothetical protein
MFETTCFDNIMEPIFHVNTLNLLETLHHENMTFVAIPIIV